MFKLTKHQQFEQCLARAKEIVASYRSEAPEGCDPQSTWVAIGVTVVGTAVSAGSQMYASSQQKKAEGKKAEAIKNGTQELTPTLLGDPKQIDTRAVNLKGIDQIYDYIPYARKLSDNVNSYNYSRAHQYYNKIQPYFDQIQKQVGSNALDFSKGKIPDDVAQEVQRRAAEKGIEGGFGFGSQGAKQGALANLNLRNLGLLSLDLSKYGSELGMRANQSAKSLLPNMISPLDLFLNPGQQLSAEQYNVNAQNDFLVQNNATVNNANQQNTSLRNNMNATAATAAYNGDVAQAQMYAQVGQQVGGAISGSAGLFGGSKSATASPSGFPAGSNANDYGLNNWGELEGYLAS